MPRFASVGNERLGLEIEILSLVALHSQSAGPAIDIIKCRVLNNYYCALNTLSPSGRLHPHGNLTWLIKVWRR